MAKISQLPQDMPILNAQLAQLTALQNQVAGLSEAASAGAYTPTIAALTGTFTTAHSRGRFFQRAPNLVYVEINIKIQAHGTGAYIWVGLPQQSAQSFTQMLPGRENAIGGKMLQLRILPGATTALLLNYDNSDPVVDGGDYFINGMYEVAT